MVNFFRLCGNDNFMLVDYIYIRRKGILTKMKRLIFILGLMLSMPGLALANDQIVEKGLMQADSESKDSFNGKNGAEECDCEKQEDIHRNWQAKMAEREQKLLTWIDQYTPEKKAEWTKVLEEKKELRNKWLSPELAQKREQWKQEKMAKIQDLRKQLEEGKITKEEFVKQAHGGKNLGHWKTFHDLKTAVEAKNDKQAAQLLNHLLEQTKQHNEKMKEMINK